MHERVQMAAVNSKCELKATRQLCHFQSFNHYFVGIMRSDASDASRILQRCGSPGSFLLHLFTLHTWSVTSVMWKGNGRFHPCRVISPQPSERVRSDRENTRRLIKYISWRAWITESDGVAGLSSSSLARSWGCEATAQHYPICFTPITHLYKQQPIWIHTSSYEAIDVWWCWPRSLRVHFRKTERDFVSNRIIHQLGSKRQSALIMNRTH